MTDNIRHSGTTCDSTAQLRFARPVLFLVLCALSLLAPGCEQIVDDPGTLPYEEKLVVRGILTASQPLDTITLTRTLPPLDEYSDEQAWVRGALVLLRHSGRVDTLTDYGKGLYYSPTIVPQVGEVFELTVEWKGLRASAVTRIPSPPTIVAARVDRRYSRYGSPIDLLQASVQPRTGEVYAATYRYAYPGSHWQSTYNYIDDLYRATDTNAEGLVPVTAESYVYSSSSNYEYTMFVHAYDEPFYTYYTSYRGDGDDPLTQPGQNIRWNVTGDGIGMFIGMATTEREL